MRTAVVLPAPFGPRRPKTVPSSTTRSRPRNACVLPYRFSSPSARMAALLSFIGLLRCVLAICVLSNVFVAPMQAEACRLWPDFFSQAGDLAVEPGDFGVQRVQMMVE